MLETARDPAFPILNPSLSPDGQGITLRDYFAAKAMQAIIQAAYMEGYHIDEVADESYGASDAMLVAREKGVTP